MSTGGGEDRPDTPPAERSASYAPESAQSRGSAKSAAEPCIDWLREESADDETARFELCASERVERFRTGSLDVCGVSCTMKTGCMGGCCTRRGRAGFGLKPLPKRTTQRITLTITMAKKPITISARPRTSAGLASASAFTRAASAAFMVRGVQSGKPAIGPTHSIVCVHSACLDSERMHFSKCAAPRYLLEARSWPIVCEILSGCLKIPSSSAEQAAEIAADSQCPSKIGERFD